MEISWTPPRRPAPDDSRNRRLGLRAGGLGDPVVDRVRHDQPRDARVVQGLMRLAVELRPPVLSPLQAIDPALVAVDLGQISFGGVFEAVHAQARRILRLNPDASWRERLADWTPEPDF